MCRILSLALAALIGCGKKPESPTPSIADRSRGPASAFSADDRGFIALWTVLRDGTDAEVAALWRDLHPTREDFRKILNEEYYAKVADSMAGLWERNRSYTDAQIAKPGRPRPGWNLNEVDKATTEDLRDQTEAGRRLLQDPHLADVLARRHPMDLHRTSRGVRGTRKMVSVHGARKRATTDYADCHNGSESVKSASSVESVFLARFTARASPVNGYEK